MNGDGGASHCYAGFLVTWRVNAGALRSRGWPSVPPSVVIIGNSHGPLQAARIQNVSRWLRRSGFSITAALTGPPPINIDIRNDAISGSASNAWLSAILRYGTIRRGFSSR